MSTEYRSVQTLHITKNARNQQVTRTILRYHLWNLSANVLRNLFASSKYKNAVFDDASNIRADIIIL